jgi:hypothetical protein
MPHVSEMIVSKFIGHAEVQVPVAVTIRTVSLENVARQGAEEEQRWIMWFAEMRKGLRLNVTNLRILEAAFGDRSEGWVGKRIQLYWDPTVQFGGKLVGGVRFRVGRAAAGHPVSAPAGARFDPMTGKPLTPQTPALPPQARFDPMTGLPLAQTAAAAPGPAPAGVDPATGEFQPFPPASAYAGDPEFQDDDFPF